MSKKTSILIVLAVSVAMLVGCARYVIKTEKPQNIAELKRKIDELQNYNNGIDYFQGKAIVIYRKKQGDEEKVYSFRARVYSSPENNLRINISDFLLNKPVLSVSVVSKSVTIVDHLHLRLIQKNMEEIDLSSFIELPLPLDFFMKSITGKVYIIGPEDYLLSGSTSILEISNSKSKEIIYFNSDPLPARIELIIEDRHIIVSFEKRINESNSVPKKIVFTTGDESLEINYSQILVGECFEDSIFLMNDIDTSRLKKVN